MRIETLAARNVVFYANQYDHPVDPPDEEELATPSDEPEISTSQVEKLASAKTITDINIEIETEMGVDDFGYMLFDSSLLIKLLSTIGKCKDCNSNINDVYGPNAKQKKV